MSPHLLFDWLLDDLSGPQQTSRHNSSRITNFVIDTNTTIPSWTRGFKSCSTLLNPRYPRHMGVMMICVQHRGYIASEYLTCVPRAVDNKKLRRIEYSGGTNKRHIRINLPWSSIDNLPTCVGNPY